MRTFTVPPTVRRILAIILGLTVVSACGQGTSPTPSPTFTTTTASPSGTPVEVTAYYVGATTRGPRLFRETHTVTTTLDSRTAAVAEVFARPLDPDYVSAWEPFGVSVNSVARSKDVITVDLHGISGLRARPAGMKAAMASRAVDQILWTVKDVFGVGKKVAVQLLADGSHIDKLLGVPVSEPLAFPDPESTLAQVWITNLTEGDTVASPVRVEGLGTAFEAQIVWLVYDESGSLVEQGWTLAQAWCCMTPFAFTVTLSPGTYSIVVEDTDPSGGEGPGPWHDSKTVTVT